MVWMCTTHGSSLMHGNWKQLSSFQNGLFGFSFPLAFILAFTITFCSFHYKMVMDSLKNLHIYGLIVLTLDVGHTYVREWGWSW
jgi:hypothetical protein